MRLVVARLVAAQTVERLVGEVQPAKRGVWMLEVLDDTEGMGVVIETARIRHALFKRLFPRMTKRRVPQVMGQDDGLGQRFVGSKHGRKAAGDLSGLQGVCQSGAEMIVKRRREDLRLMLQAAEGRTLDDAVAVQLKRTANGLRWFGVYAPARLG